MRKCHFTKLTCWKPNLLGNEKEECEMLANSWLKIRSNISCIQNTNNEKEKRNLNKQLKYYFENLQPQQHYHIKNLSKKVYAVKFETTRHGYE
ncbi:CLUMA_CG021155, isoform A [Clunio marinus]|uniref:CLUMA_CG021155, isoform A n=1 Tax=Clunio marinus TaxID=568069 RepID=A0A1J1J6Z7_9DIPT|nr:CLUMA_CG021155, isoform A [Clunio marinus]